MRRTLETDEGISTLKSFTERYGHFIFVLDF